MTSRAVLRQSVNAVTAMVTALALIGCQITDTGPRDRMPPEPAPVTTPAAPAQSAESAAAQAYYAQVQQALLSQGLLRTDGGGEDTPFNERMLTENFVRIALFDEYGRDGGGASVQRQTTSTLRRWIAPVRIGLRFGASVSPERRGTDRARVASYVARLQALTGHPIRLDEANPNFFVHIVSEDERRTLGPALRAALPGVAGPDVSDMVNLPRSTYCLVYAQTNGSSSTYVGAFAVIRAEHPDLMRLSCIHEEIAQGLGLPNDSPTARPSIFNDDEEFALLTRMDEAMLRILYNPSLRPGMTEGEARPIITTLATRLVGGES
ncbi:MAG: DUF2927 domain-containing protein [Paracoccaceae bacterium]